MERVGWANGEGGIRTLGSLLSYGALAKRCFQPLSHLTKICSHGLHHSRDYRRVENIAKNQTFPICNLQLPTSSRARDLIAVANRPLPTD